MTIHELRLAAEPFAAIAAGRKTIESRLFDEKRQLIQPGDSIIFTNRDDSTQTLRVKVTGLQHYNSFAELLAHDDPAMFGGSSQEELLTKIRQFYSPEEELQYGVLGIEFKLA